MRLIIKTQGLHYMDQKDFEEGIEWILKQLSVDKIFYKKMC